jgi:7-carboxy-7-deazaguanine synthase
MAVSLKLAKLDDGPEIFHTIQGEGPSAGCPAVFIRASHCNLHCVWCDTDHTWNFEGSPWPHEKDQRPGYEKHRKSEVMLDLEPAEAARRILDFGSRRVVITGGEPLLQEPGFLEMVGLIRREMPDCAIEVETNGTRIPSADFVEIVDQFNVSPKLANAGIPAALRLNDEALRFFARCPKAWFKFVVSSPEDVLEIQELRVRFGIGHGHILLMPEGRSAEQLDRQAPWLAETCRDLGFRFCDRLHIRLWGDRRGV